MWTVQLKVRTALFLKVRTAKIDTNRILEDNGISKKEKKKNRKKYKSHESKSNL